MKSKQQTTEKPTDHRRNKKGNQNMHRNKWKRKTHHHQWDSVKAVLKGRFTAIQAYLRKQEKHQISNLTSNVKQLEKEEKKNPKVNRRKEIIKIRAEVNEKETKETIAKINKTKSWLFEKINKIDKLLARLIKKKKEKNQINKVRNKNGEITTDNTNTKDHKRLLWATICQKMGNLEKMDKFLENYNLPNLSQKENLNRPNHKHGHQNCNQKSSNKQKSRTKWDYKWILSKI